MHPQSAQAEPISLSIQDQTAITAAIVKQQADLAVSNAKLLELYTKQQTDHKE